MSAWIGRSSHGKAAAKIVPPDPRIPRWKGLGADSEEKREPASDIDTVPADSLKALDLDRPIREADVSQRLPDNQLPLARACEPRQKHPKNFNHPTPAVAGGGTA